MNKYVKGFVLVASLAILTIMTMISIFMFSGLTQDQRMAGDFREKSRALDAAQTALNSVETFLSLPGNAYLGPNNWAAGITCNANGSNAPSTTPVICNAPLANPYTVPWSSYTIYTPTGMSVAASGQNMYSSTTSIYTYFMGKATGNAHTALYQVTAAAKGGNDATTVVAQTVFKVTAASIDLGGG
jgi:type IV pilus assembly protein PilX